MYTLTIIVSSIHKHIFDLVSYAWFVLIVKIFLKKKKLLKRKLRTLRMEHMLRGLLNQIS